MELAGIKRDRETFLFAGHASVIALLSQIARINSMPGIDRSKIKP